MTPSLSQSYTKLISDAIAQLRGYSQVNIQSCWLSSASHREITDVMASNLADWQAVELNAKGNIAWNGGQNVLWLAQKFTVPESLHGYPVAGLCLRLSLLWWADSVKIYVNGELVSEGDLFDCSPRILLSPEVTPGEEFIIALRLVSPGHCEGALVRSLLMYESTDYNYPDPGFIADELAILQLYLEKFAPEQLDSLATIINQYPTHTPETLISLRQHLINYLSASTFIDVAKFKIYLLGHAHLDLAWLWPVSETWNAAQNTFESVLKLQQDFPELIFCHSTPAMYAWIEEHRPDLFETIQQKVVDGVWEIVGGFWVEPDLNLISGESIVRQLLYGQRYVQEKFGKLTSVVWVPDTFGFCATLPQFLANAGIEYFVTQKLRWNDTNKFDYSLFWWRSPDGSQVLSYMSAPIGEGIDPVKMTAYALEWQTQTHFTASLWLPGVGDHGGGPTRDMLETARRWQTSPFFPDLEFITSEKYLQQILAEEQRSRTITQSPVKSPQYPIPSPQSRVPNTQYPTWNDELYLEFHRGCYTTHADQKRWNRSSENLLYQAELFASLAHIICGVTYPKAEIETAWKQVLFHQFHDILPGSSITQVYRDALPQWQQVEQIGTKILQESLQAIASHFTLPDPPHPDSLPIFVFNPLNWQRSEVVSLNIPTPHQQYQIYDTTGEQLTSQLSEPSTLLFLATDIPPIGYRIFWLSPTSSTSPTSPSLPEYILENDHLRVIVDPDTGDLASIFDKTHQREILNGAGNQLQAFKDSGQYWDAWNIDPNYNQHPLPPTHLKSIEWLEQGQVQHRVRVVRQLGNSEFSQDYILQTGSPVLKIASKVNWQENQVLVKAAFPLNLTADLATYEIPCGAIRRSTQPQTPQEKAKWEVPALRWADLTETTDKGIYGVSLLNDCKYGYDAQPQQLRLTLLRSPNWPDPEADRGLHEFTYALYPHADSWQSAQTVRRGYELNIPLQVILNPTLHSSLLYGRVDQELHLPTDLPVEPAPTHSPLPNRDRLSCLNFSAENLVLMAVKPSEDEPDKLIIRCYESQGETAELSLQSDIGLTLGEAVDLLERPMTGNSTIKPGKIASFKLI